MSTTNKKIFLCQLEYISACTEGTSEQVHLLRLTSSHLYLNDHFGLIFWWWKQSTGMLMSIPELKLIARLSMSSCDL